MSSMFDTSLPTVETVDTTTVDPNVEAARIAELDAQKSLRGRSSTLLTGSAPAMTPANTPRARLLGAG